MAAPNGIPFPGDANRYIAIEKMDPEPANDMVKGYIERRVTRCVRALDVDGDCKFSHINLILNCC